MYAFSQGLWTSTEATAYQLAMLWASAGNTVPAAFWVLYYILRTPGIQKEVVAEVEAARAAHSGNGNGNGNGTGKALLSQAQLNGLVVLDACITESMRLASGTPLAPRPPTHPPPSPSTPLPLPYLSPSRHCSLYPVCVRACVQGRSSCVWCSGPQR
jgi:cytochrome P450